MADLHIHTQLSPCASLEMSPDRILAMAKQRGLDAVGITDHNSTLQCKVVREMGQDAGIEVLMGAEVTTREEVHCLVYFPEEESLDLFQHFLRQHLPMIPNDPRRFGYQVVVDRHNNIVYEEQVSLLSALDVSLEELIEVTHKLGGLAIPAHVDRQRFGLIGQLGFVPDNLMADALEFSVAPDVEAFLVKYPALAKYALTSGSDAHHPEQIGTRPNFFDTEKFDFLVLKEMLSTGSIRNNLLTKL